MFDVFLSCSYQDVDAPVVAIVSALCKGLQLQCRNLTNASTALPPTKAKEIMTGSIGLIAVATRRDRQADGKYRMPSAVHDEISIAFGLNKPVLLLAESEVTLDGFMLNYGTHVRFDRHELTSPAVLSVLVGSIYDFARECAPFVVRADETYRDGQEYHSELTTNLVSLEQGKENPIWVSSLTKRLRFDAPFSRELVTGSWAGVPLPIEPGSPNIQWEVNITAGSRHFDIRATPHVVTPAQVRLACRIVPDPRVGDFLEFSRVCRSKYLNVLYRSQLETQAPDITIDGKGYLAHSGFVPVEPTMRLRVQFRAPRWYGVGRDDYAVFVASHATSVEYLVPSELRRISSRIDSFAGDFVVDIEVEYPLPRHMYGVAWNPPDCA
jgi:hypothetical protein